jgi:pilus assembly protein FimV
MRRGLIIPITCLALAGGLGCSSSGKSGLSDGGAGQGGTGVAGAGGAAGTTGAAGAAGAAGSGGAPVDAGSSHAICHTNAECTPPEVCYIGAGSSVICSGPAGACVRFTSPCTSTDKCTCLDVPAGSCTGVPGSSGCQGQDAGSGCWVCILPV